jgi:hypothetical protein
MRLRLWIGEIFWKMQIQSVSNLIKSTKSTRAPVQGDIVNVEGGIEGNRVYREQREYVSGTWQFNATNCGPLVGYDRDLNPGPGPTP